MSLFSADRKEVLRVQFRSGENRFFDADNKPQKKELPIFFLMRR